MAKRTAGGSILASTEGGVGKKWRSRTSLGLPSTGLGGAKPLAGGGNKARRSGI